MSLPLSVHVLSGGAAYLWNPPNDSWVSSFANLFFVLGILVASPIFFLLALDFTSYAIVRTLGIEHAHPVSSKAGLTITPSTPTSSTPSPVDTLSQQKGTPKQRPKNISIPTLNQSLTIDQVQPFFTTPGGRGANPNLELSGLFSPPESRTPSPPSDSYIYLDHQGTPRVEEEVASSPSNHARLEGAYDAGNADDRDADRVAGANDQVLLRRRKGGPIHSQS